MCGPDCTSQMWKTGHPIDLCNAEMNILIRQPQHDLSISQRINIDTQFELYFCILQVVRYILVLGPAEVLLLQKCRFLSHAP